MQIRVRLFAIVRERAGVGEFDLDVGPGTTVAFAAEAIVARFPALLEPMRRVAFAVNETYADSQVVLQAGDELAILPPVSGGCGAAAAWNENSVRGHTYDDVVLDGRAERLRMLRLRGTHSLR